MAKTEYNVRVWFIWEGVDNLGVLMKGELAARTELVARAMLRNQGIRVVKLKKSPRRILCSGNRRSSLRISLYLAVSWRPCYLPEYR